MPGWPIVSALEILGMIFVSRIGIQMSSLHQTQFLTVHPVTLGTILNSNLLSLMTHQSPDPLSLAFWASFHLPLPIHPRST